PGADDRADEHEISAAALRAGPEHHERAQLSRIQRDADVAVLRSSDDGQRDAKDRHRDGVELLAELTSPRVEPYDPLTASIHSSSLQCATGGPCVRRGQRRATSYYRHIAWSRRPSTR